MHYYCIIVDSHANSLHVVLPLTIFMTPILPPIKPTHKKKFAGQEKNIAVCNKRLTAGVNTTIRNINLEKSDKVGKGFYFSDKGYCIHNVYDTVSIYKPTCFYHNLCGKF